VVSNIAMAQTPGIMIQQYLEVIKDIVGSCPIAIRILELKRNIKEIGNISTVAMNLALLKRTPHIS